MSCFECTDDQYSRVECIRSRLIEPFCQATSGTDSTGCGSAVLIVLPMSRQEPGPALVLEPIAFPADREYVTAVQKTVEDRGGDETLTSMAKASRLPSSITVNIRYRRVL